MSTDYIGQAQPGITSQSATGDRFLLNRSSNLDSRTRPSLVVKAVQVPSVSTAGEADSTGDSLIRRFPPVDVGGTAEVASGLYWLEKLHPYPGAIELGNMLSTVVRDIVIYSSFREEVQTLDTATNNAGTGISFIGLPTLAAIIQPNSGLEFQVQILQQGQPTIDGTLDFGTSYAALSIPITGSRVVMMAYEPIGSIQEHLEFLTDIMRSANGKEQRVCARNHPRQTFDYNYMVAEGDERRKLETFLYKWHSQVFGVPVWFESKRLTAAVTAGDTTIHLNPDYSDFRVGGLLILWTDYETFDSLEISSVGASSIEVTSPATQAFAVGTKVMPLRTAITKQEISGDKYRVNLSTMAIKFQIIDNEVDLSDSSAFSEHNSKVMFNDLNWVPRTTNTDTLKRLLHKIDNGIGSPIHFTDWENSHPITSKGFFCQNPQAVSEMRNVLHYLNGRQKSFYLPTFYTDVVVSQDLSSGNNAMDIDLIGYSDFIDGNEPNKSLYIILTNGTILTRQVASSTVLNETTERLVLTETWDYDITVDEVYRVSFLRLGRFANDKFVINHNDSGQATLKATVQGVIQ